MKSLLFAIILLALPQLAYAQFGETIRTGRPGQAIGPFTLGKNVFQVQSGVSLNRVETAPIITKSFTHSTVLRMGIWERIELSSVINWQTNNVNNNGIESSSGGISNTQIGGRVNICKQKGILPTIGLQGRILLKAQGKDFRREKLGSKFILATGNKISDALSVITNLGITWNGNNTPSTSFYILNLSFALSEKMGGFVEVYGDLSEFSTNYDTGFSFLINKDLQLDFSTGWQGSKGTSDWFIDTGVSWRIDWRN